jgi:CRP/FNR family transcriptional activator FtrB
MAGEVDMRAGDSERVNALPIFATLEKSDFAKLVAAAFLQRFPAGTQLLLEGDRVDFLYVLLDGQVELAGSWQQKDTVLAVLQPVSTFILAAVVLDAPALMTARTLSKSEILMIPAAAIRTLMGSDASFAVAIARELSGGYRRFVRAIKNQKLRSGVERLANYLLQLRDRSGDDRFPLPVEKRVIASLLGMSPENLSRAFATLGPYGVIVEGSEIRLTMVEDLQRLARPNALIEHDVADEVSAGAGR